MEKSDGYSVAFCLAATAAGFAISRAFFALLARSRIHFARIIPLRFAAAVGTVYFVRVDKHQLVEFLSAIFTFVL